GPRLRHGLFIKNQGSDYAHYCVRIWRGGPHQGWCDMYRTSAGILVLGILIAICGRQLQGQNPSPPQITTQEQLTVRVSFEDDHPVRPGIRVQLLSIYGSSIDIRATDSSGTVTFIGLAPAKYKARVLGDGVVPTESDEIDLTDSGPHMTEFVRVK